MTDAYAREEQLLSTRTRLHRNVFFALGTTRDRAAAAHRQGRTNTSELGFVDKPPKHAPRNVSLGRTSSRGLEASGGGGRGDGRAGGSAQSAIYEDEMAVKRMQMQMTAAAEAAASRRPAEEQQQPEAVAKRHESTLGTAGVTISPLLRFGPPASAPGSAASSARHGGGPASGLSSARSRPRSAKELVRAVELDQQIAAMRTAALHPTAFARQAIREHKREVEQLSARPSFGPPPPWLRPGDSGDDSARVRVGSSGGGGGGGDGAHGIADGEDRHHHHQRGGGGPRPIPKASDFVLPWEREKVEVARVVAVDTAAADAHHHHPSSSDGTHNNNTDHHHQDDIDAAGAAQAELDWQRERQRILDGFGLLDGSRAAESVKKRAGLIPTQQAPPTLVDMANQLTRDHAASYHARSNETTDLVYSPHDDATGRARHRPTVKMSTYSRRFINVRPFHHVPDDLLRTGHLLKTVKSMVDRERNNFVRLLTDATERELQLLKSTEDPVQVARCHAAKQFLRQFQPPESVDVPGLPLTAADDARFNDGFTTTTRARPKTSSEVVVTRKFKGAPHLAAFADRPLAGGADDAGLAREFGIAYHQVRREAAREVDAALAAAHAQQRGLAM